MATSEKPQFLAWSQHHGRTTRLMLAIVLLFLLASPGAIRAAEFDYFKPGERAQPLVLPENYLVSKYGRGLYRIDGMESHGRLNCIFLTFTATPPEGATAAASLDWKTEQVEVEGRKIVRLSAVLANPFPREASADGDVLSVRIDALTPAVAEELRRVAEGFLSH